MVLIAWLAHLCLSEDRRTRHISKVRERVNSLANVCFNSFVDMMTFLLVHKPIYFDSLVYKAMGKDGCLRK